MRWLLALSSALLLAAPAKPELGDPPASPQTIAAQDRVKAHMPKGDKTQARKDAEQAVQEGEFSFISVIGDWDERGPSPLGVTCFTPGGESPASVAVIGVGDYTPPEDMPKYDYGSAYNKVIVEHPDYPDRDLCTGRSERNEMPSDNLGRVTVAAQAVSGPPRGLFEAARRGSAQEVRRLINRKTLNARDSFAMTPLAWAVARNNRPAIDALLTAGANPWQPGQEPDYLPSRTAVYWAAALGRRAIFLRLQRLRGREFEEGWPSNYLAAAMNSNDLVIFATMLVQRHEEIRFDYLRHPLPKTQMFAMAVKKQRNLATPLLFEALGYETDRPELVRMALANGADPNAVEPGGNETPLDKVARGHSESCIAIVDMLLKAGANPNEGSAFRRPVWDAYDMMIQEERFPEFARRARIIFDRLLAAGADLNLPNRQGLPPIWFLLFPYSPNHDRLDPSDAPPAQLEMLASRGLDVNGEWNGKRVMGLVEAQAGLDAELTKTLRKLGAKP